MAVPLPAAQAVLRAPRSLRRPTRSDVARSSAVVEYVHLGLAGEPGVGEREVVNESIGSMRRRRRGAVHHVTKADRAVLVDRPGLGS